MNRAFTVMDLPAEERPRERLVKYGAENVSVQELIAVLLGRGTAGRPVMVIAQDLLGRFGSLVAIVSASVEDLQSVEGLGLAKSLQLKACMEIARRVVREEDSREKAKNVAKAAVSSEDIARVVRPLIRNWQKEHYFVISLDNRNRVLGIDLVGVGTLNASLVHPRETFQVAIGRHAACLVVCHNHPSGDAKPSEADLIVTKRLKEAGQLMGIQLLDHVIICQTILYSFRENQGW